MRVLLIGLICLAPLVWLSLASAQTGGSGRGEGWPAEGGAGD